MTLEVDINGIDDVVILRDFIVAIAHEGLKITVAYLILISQGQVQVLVELIAEATGDAVSRLPVGEVGSRTIVATLAIKRTVSESVFLIHGRHPIVAQTDSHLWRGLIFQTHLDGIDGTERLLGVTIHDIIALAKLVSDSVLDKFGISISPEVNYI